MFNLWAAGFWLSHLKRLRNYYSSDYFGITKYVFLNKQIMQKKIFGMRSSAIDWRL